MNTEDMMKQAQQMQEEMVSLQESLGTVVTQGAASGNLVSVSMNGHFKVKSISISDKAAGSNKSVLESLIVSAFNDASNKVEENNKNRFAELAGKFEMPEQLEQAG